MRFIIPLILLSVSSAGLAEAFFVENAKLSPVTPQIAEAINAFSKEPVTSTRDVPCKFIGQKVMLGKNESQESWLVTTANVCAWGASNAPIWAVKKTSSGHSVVFSTVAYSVKIGDKSQYGMRNLSVLYGSGHTEELWKYDGSQYKLVKTRDLQ